MLVNTSFRMNAFALVVLVFIYQVLALKCTFTYSSAELDKEETISDPQEGRCLKLDFLAYKLDNRCYVSAEAYVGADCDGDSTKVRGGETYTSRHDIYKSVKFA